jgi:hypothetical protein
MKKSFLSMVVCFTQLSKLNFVPELLPGYVQVVCFCIDLIALLKKKFFGLGLAIIYTPISNRPGSTP